MITIFFSFCLPLKNCEYKVNKFVLCYCFLQCWNCTFILLLLSRNAAIVASWISSH